MSEDTRIFKVKKDGQDVELYVRNPTLKDREQADSVKIRRWNQALKDGAVLAEKLNDVLREQGVWSDEKENKVRDLQLELMESIGSLNKGGIKLSDAKKLAIKIREIRLELRIISIERARYVDMTAEGQSQNSYFDYIVSSVTVYNNDRNKRYFENYEDYLNRAQDTDGFICANKCAEIFYDIGDDNRPENIFLKKYKFVNNDLRLINESGEFVDTEGKLIPKEIEEVTGPAIYLDENGEAIVEEDKKDEKEIIENVSTGIESVA